MKRQDLLKNIISVVFIVTAYYLSEKISLNWFNTTNFWVEMLILFVIYIAFELVKYIIVLKIREKKNNNGKEEK